MIVGSEWKRGFDSETSNKGAFASNSATVGLSSGFGLQHILIVLATDRGMASRHVTPVEMISLIMSMSLPPIHGKLRVEMK